MSDDIVKAVGKLEANYEHLREHQQKLEASIEAMPKKINDMLAQELKNQITTLNADITVKIGKVQSELELKLGRVESELPKKWVFYLWAFSTMFALFSLMFGFGYFVYNQTDKNKPNIDIVDSINTTNQLLTDSLVQQNKTMVDTTSPQTEKKVQP
ncbi:MAG: hypothetical protein EAY65_01720 [Alphaproteobacteria bacterium]|nr:MAG: hypothetical protein EAY65_01720 [Alphaproteobacteria bacterium]